ncbi:MAG: glutamate-cysteine ligase family protein [Planctomycetota bacterium]|nr:glutamate-cysteine ligase family protein [Planctomycetota bacterium]
MAKTLSLFEAFGIELEYMIVAADSLDVCPITDRVLHAVAGAFEAEVELGDISWSNELALHVIELKTTAPIGSLAGLSDRFQAHVARINDLLLAHNARLMPTAIHPWMDPHAELQLWPHDHSAVYEAFNRVFDCTGHGWANLQSVHLNLPFAGDEEFGKLHAAIRLLLPLLPALAASSPIIERRASGFCDTRLAVYRTNSKRVPSVSGLVIPEPVFTREAYEREIFAKMYADIAPLDPDGTLQHEWLNSRGAIARFDRNAIEIRVLDIQECPAADLAICRLIIETLRRLIAEEWLNTAAQQAFATERLASILSAVIRDADEAIIDDSDFLWAFGISTPVTASELWRRLATPLLESTTEFGPAMRVILEHGPLSRRILKRVTNASSDAGLLDTYRELCQCLATGKMFRPDEA